MKLRKTEILLTAALVLLLLLFILWPKEPGNTIDVSIDGTTVLTLNLDDSGSYPVPDYGGYSLRVVVEDGKVWVEDSNCPDLVCQKHAPISQAGEQIVCLPHRLVITVVGEEAQADAAVG